MQSSPASIFNMQWDLLSPIRRFSCKEVGVIGLRWGCIFGTSSRKLRGHIFFSFYSSSWWTPWRWPWIRCSWHYRICWWCRMASTAAVTTATAILPILVVGRCLGVNIYCTKRSRSHSNSRQHLYHRGFTPIWYLFHCNLTNKNYV